MYQLRVLLLRAKKHADNLGVSPSDAASSGDVRVPAPQAASQHADMAAETYETQSVAAQGPAFCSDNPPACYPPHKTSGGDLHEEAPSCAAPGQGVEQDHGSFLSEPTHEAFEADTGESLPGNGCHPVIP